MCPFSEHAPGRFMRNNLIRLCGQTIGEFPALPDEICAKLTKDAGIRHAQNIFQESVFM